MAAAGTDVAHAVRERDGVDIADVERIFRKCGILATDSDSNHEIRFEEDSADVFFSAYPSCQTCIFVFLRGCMGPSTF